MRVAYHFFEIVQVQRRWGREKIQRRFFRRFEGDYNGEVQGKHYQQNGNNRGYIRENGNRPNLFHNCPTSKRELILICAKETRDITTSNNTEIAMA